ncbi:hypothetical protein OH76DRAFT_1366643 [Lentinus brumalis]|uniref:DUF4100 domain-containing protein n=1 Tax=Lentinus brumalis TaxID=2498619 RepID=A0A371CIS1_9APHY|nr:hypothetical protein OH76DRAFT_1366643 [Polyporus brumalis]
MPPKTAGHLPLREDKKAPRFKGKHVEEFITSLEHLADVNTVEDKHLPKAVVRYASSKVKSVLEAEVAFEGEDWVLAKERLRYIFGSLTRTHKPEPRKLRKFVEESAAESSVTSLVTLDHYNFEFSRKAGRLVQDGAMSERELNDLFHQGLPKKLRTAILKDLADIVRKRSGKGLSTSNQPTKAEILDTARDHYKAVEAMRRGVGADSSSADSESDSRSSGTPASDSSSDSDGESHGKHKSRDRSQSHSDSELEPLYKKDLHREFQAMTQKWFRENGFNATPVAAPSNVIPVPPALNLSVPSVSPLFHNPMGPPQFSAMQGAGSSQYPQRTFTPRVCYVCGKTEGVDLDHLLGTHRCPETARLIQDGLAIFSPVNGRLSYPKGQPLPSTDFMPQGIAAFLRDQLHTTPQQQQQQPLQPQQPRRDPPPHQASVMSVGLCRDGVPVLSYSTEASVSIGHALSLPVTTRSHSRPTTPKSVHWQDSPSSPTETTAPPPPAGTTAAPATTPPAPANTQKGWRDSQREKTRAPPSSYDDSISRNRTTGRQSPLRFSSEVQDSVSVSSLEDHILGTRVTLTLRECLGMSTSLQKRMAALVKTRRDFGSSIPSESAATHALSCGVPAADPGGPAQHLEAEISFTQGMERLDDLLDRYAASIALADSRQFAMVSGVIELVFAGKKAAFLVDSGSELNLASQRLYDPKTMNLDEDGSRWTLRGIGGDPIALLGCALDVPVQLGGRNFDHHFFISTSHYGSHDGILGQPWLSFFAARFEYSRDGATMLKVHPSGSTDGPSVAVQMCPPRHPRNADRLVLTAAAANDTDDATTSTPPTQDF